MTGLLLERVDPAEFADVLKSLADFADNKTAIADCRTAPVRDGRRIKKRVPTIFQRILGLFFQ
jgi:hypothetical protein